MARNNSQPLTFHTPDDDTIPLITWDYVLDKLDTEMTMSLESLSKINSYLERIDTRAKYWLDSQKEEGDD